MARSLSSSLEHSPVLSLPRCGWKDSSSYTDSIVALYWILGTDRVWKQFVQHRVVEIRKILPNVCWYHCPGVDNPADLPSRGVKASDLAKSELWINGPEWLGTVIESEPSTEMPTECCVELKVKDRPMVLNVVTAHDNPDLEQVIDCQRYSFLQKLLNVTVLVLRFVHTLKQRAKNATEEGTIDSDSKKAEVLWIRAAQDQLRRDPSFDKLTKQFGLFLDDDRILRCGGRLSRAELPYSVKHPVLLPRQHHLAALIVRRAHQRVLHNGVKETLAEVRSQYWIVKGRASVKKIIRQCIVCKRFEGRSCLGPSPPPLPDFRLSQEPPFTFTGVDFAGPLFVRPGGGAPDHKVWICLYTCCVTRAVHLDIVSDLTTAAFLRSLKRFSARRGLPRLFVSDNGKTFKAASKAIKEIMQHQDVQQYLSGVGVEWRFNLPRAPWWGGVFERMIRMTKRCLKKLIGRGRLNLDELNTLIIEIEGVINSRPISYVTSDDSEEPLTPCHLLCGRRLLSLPDSICYTDPKEEYGISREHLTRRLIDLNKLLSDFWSRWQKEYLLELRDSHRYGGKTSNKTQVSVGDVVLVQDTKPRAFWKLARVSKLFTGQDGHVHGAELKVASSGHRAHTMRRPLQSLYPLELSTPSATDDSTAVKQTNEVPQEDHGILKRSTRPVRAAARRAQDCLRAVHLHEEDSDLN